EARRHPPTKGSIGEFLDKFENDLCAMHCEKCVARRIGDGAPDVLAAAMCDGRNDLDNLQFGALCWETFAELFKFGVKTAQEAYSDVLRTDQNEFLNVKLHTRITTDAEFGAKTLFPEEDRPGQRSAIVELTIPIEEFDEGYYLRLPYYIFHEVC